MRKIVSLAVVFVLILAFIFMNITENVQAYKVSTSTPVVGIAAGTWNTGTEIDVDLTAAPASPWLQLLARGVKLTEPAKICHPFRGGQYHWVGEIRLLIDGKWVKIETVNDWVPTKEGTFMSCAQAPAAGIYALFGYYNGPYEYPVAPSKSQAQLDCEAEGGYWNGSSCEWM